MRLAYVDCETVSLKPGPATMWEVALIIRDEPGSAASDTEWVWQMRPDLTTADAGALKIGGFHQRCTVPAGYEPGDAKLVHGDEADSAFNTVQPGWRVAQDIANYLDGAVLVGANVGSFDVPHLDGYLRAHGECLAADYHYLDIGSLVMGWAAGKASGFRGACELLRGLHSKSCDLPVPEPEKFPPLTGPLKLNAAAQLAGLNPDDYEAHTALGDARLVRDIWDAVMSS
jgi:hypothetical protein